MSRRMLGAGKGRAAAGIAASVVLLGAAVAVATTAGPDVTVITIGSIGNYGSSGGYHGYSIGATSCNVGDKPVWWCNESDRTYCTSDQHPVIAQNLYRLKGGRFEQIGMSWLKHGFLSTNSPNSACNPAIPCTIPAHFGDQLGLGCTDTYGSSLNGQTPLGKRSEVDATTGVFPYPYTAVGTSTVVDERVKVLESDLEPVQNAGALYWAEVQYVTADDAQTNNGFNNASYRSLTAGGAPSFTLTLTGSTVREKTAVYAWKAADPAVEIANADFVTDPSVVVERFEIGRRATDLGGGWWHYEYAVRNVNSDRAAQAFTVAFPPGTTVQNAGAHVINHHSGEPYATFDWDVDTSDGNAVTWSTDPFGTDPDANALRWGTMFSFWVDADQDPTSAADSIALFGPGTPAAVTVPYAALFANGFERGTLGAWSGGYSP